MLFDGQLLNTMSEADRTKLRRTAFGFVFQFGQLVPELTAADNVALPLLLNRTKRKVAYKTADTWLDKLGIGDKGGRRTGELSGGEAQRVAVARALALAPKVIFADEPTGSLDSLTGEKVMDLMTDLAREQGTTVVIVTHDARIAAYADRVVTVRDGIVSLRRPPPRSRAPRPPPLGEGRGLMLRLGLRLTLRSGREALVRLLITAAAVAVGVALLLGVLAEFHAFESNANKPCWSCTQGAAVPSTLPAHGELWNNSVDFYQGQTISRLDVAALGPDAPVPPGVTHLPPAGDYYASPALAALLRTVPADELGERFPGKMIGTIGQAGLDGAGDLAIYIGHTPAQLSKHPRHPVGHVDQPRAGPAGVHPVLPVRVRDRRARGAVPHAGADQHRHQAGRRPARGAVRRAPPRRRDAGRHQDHRHGRGRDQRVPRRGARHRHLPAGPAALAGAALVGTQYFESDLTPTAAGYVAMLVSVPVAAALAALVSLRRVQISPLGVSRRATPKPPTFWRLITLVIGLGRYVYGLCKTTRDSIGAPAYPGLLLTMIGLVIAGPWLTARAARLFGRTARGSSALLASPTARRQPAPCLPGGDRAHAGGLPRHDGRPDRARDERDRADADGRGAQQRPGRAGRAARGGGPAAHQRDQRHPRCRRLPAVRPAAARRGARPHVDRRQLRGPARDRGARTVRARATGRAGHGQLALRRQPDL